MKIREFIETLKKASVEASNARKQAIEKYSDSEDLRSAMGEFYPDFDLDARTEPVKTVEKTVEKTDEVEKPEVRNDSAAIADICELSGRSDLLPTFIREEKSLEDVRSALLKAKVEDSNPLGARFKVEVDEADKFRKTMTSAFDVRCNVSKLEDIKDNADAVGYSRAAVLDMARACVERTESTKFMTKDDIAQRALGAHSGDFSNILANTQGKILQQSYAYNEGSWRKWAGVGTVSDFKTIDVPQLAGGTEIQKVLPGGDPQKINFTDSKEQVKAESYGAAYDISYQAIVNDDLNAFTRIPTLMGAGAARKVNKDVYGVLNTNAVMGDGVALFHEATHGNLAGTPAVISNTTINLANVGMRKQTDADSNILAIAPKYMMVPVALEQVALEYLQAGLFTAPTTAANSDVFRGRYEVIAEPEMDENSATAYFFAADPMMVETLKVFFLNGQQTPQLREMESTVGSSRGRTYDVWLDYDIKALDWRGLYKNAGA